MMYAVTGAAGFLGWHTRCALRARGDEFVAIDRRTAEDPKRLAEALCGVDVVLHLAGVNRAEAEVVRTENLKIAVELTNALDRSQTQAGIVYANSIHSGGATPFGDGKQAAAQHLASWGTRAGAAVADVRLPNLFGEHGRPYYNSVVATFCHELATAGAPVIQHDRELALLHAQDAVDYLLEAATSRAMGPISPPSRPTTVTEVLDLLTEFSRLYATGDIPDITDPLHLALFNTYRSFCFPQAFPIHPPQHEDNRGQLFECVKAHGGQSQVFCSTSHPGVTRGQHFHRRKVERFMVLNGCAEIALRRLFDDKILRFQVTGMQPAIVDMPTMWAHSITNTGENELTTLFWAHELLDPQNSDTYPEPVNPLDQKVSRA